MSYPPARLHRQAEKIESLESILGLLKGLKIRALYCKPPYLLQPPPGRLEKLHKPENEISGRAEVPVLSYKPFPLSQGGILFVHTVKIF